MFCGVTSIGQLLVAIGFILKSNKENLTTNDYLLVLTNILGLVIASSMLLLNDELYGLTSFIGPISLVLSLFVGVYLVTKRKKLG